MCINNCTLCPDDILEEPAAWSICPEVELCNSSQPAGDHVGLGLGLTLGAGLATTLGALVLFIPCIKKTNTRILAISLSLAAGVMLYISFTEIFQKAQANFCCLTQDHFDLVATVCFFGGILLTILLDLLVGRLQKLECGCSMCQGRSLFTRFKGEDNGNNSPFHVTSSQMENGGPPGSAMYGSDTVPNNGILPQGEVAGANEGTEEALGPKEFQEVTEGLGKSTKELHRMGILTGKTSSLTGRKNSGG
jgi:zinc transporter ZupT